MPHRAPTACRLQLGTYSKYDAVGFPPGAAIQSPRKRCSLQHLAGHLPSLRKEEERRQDDSQRYAGAASPHDA